jgi:hypothetical protein
MTIWFRIEYDDGDHYIIYAKLGKIEFKSKYNYTVNELPDAIKSLSNLSMEDDDQ